jgi:hypothetical protein
MAEHFTESIVEQAALAWLEALGYAIAHGPEIGCGQPGADPYPKLISGELRVPDAERIVGRAVG